MSKLDSVFSKACSEITQNLLTINDPSKKQVKQEIIKICAKYALERIPRNHEILSMAKESDFDKKFRWKKISMIFQGAMNSLDPVFTIDEQFIEILKEHNFEGDLHKVILDTINSVSLDEHVLKKISS